MPANKRFSTDYPGVFFITKQIAGRDEKVYYIRYRKGASSKLIEEKAGPSPAMTASKASRLRSQKILGEKPTNQERRDDENAIPPEVWTFDKIWEAYQEDKPGLKGLVTDENRFELHIKPDFGEKEPKDLSPLDVDRIRLRLLKTRKPATVKNVLELLRRLINFAEKKRLCPGPGFKIEMPEVNNVLVEMLSQDQLKALLAAIKADTHPLAGSMIKLVLCSGLRRGEMFRLKWDDVDFDKGFIHLRDPKGGRDQVVPLNDGARAVLDALPRESDYVFPGRKGGQRVDMARHLRAIRDAAGLPKTWRPLHSGRHAFASALASSGVGLYELQKLLTHKSPQMVQRYGHLTDAALKKASRVAGDLVAKAEKAAEAKTEQDKVVNINREK